MRVEGNFYSSRLTSEAGSYKSGLLVPGGESGDYAHTGFPLRPIWGVFQGIAVAWFHGSGVRLVLREIRSCGHRIRREWKTRTVLEFDAVSHSLPQLDVSDSRMAEQPYILGIQALQTPRPLLTLGDVELFLQGWFQAERYGMGSEYSALSTAVEASTPPD